ncbi:MAG: DEAD/DEAH box helicase [Planctomycetaceae bacterium]|jgi:SNF2 family DNA or RNA helicase|nr:DEAD/DEAH box helicase [Planctomycetaceae bacterium]
MPNSQTEIQKNKSLDKLLPTQKNIDDLINKHDYYNAERLVRLELFNRYLVLPDYERKILEVMAVYVQSLSIKQLTDAINELQTEAEIDDNFFKDNITPALKKLSKEKFILDSANQKIINPIIREHIAWNLVKNNHYHTVYNAAHKGAKTTTREQITKIKATKIFHDPDSSMYWQTLPDEEDAIREGRHLLICYAKTKENIKKEFDKYCLSVSLNGDDHLLTTLLEFCDDELFDNIPQYLLNEYLPIKLRNCIHELAFLHKKEKEIAQELFLSQTSFYKSNILPELLFQYLILRGEFDTIRKLLKNAKKEYPHQDELLGILQFLEKDFSSAGASFKKARQNTKRKNSTMPLFIVLFHILYGLATKDTNLLYNLKNTLEICKKDKTDNKFWLQLECVINYLNSNDRFIDISRCRFDYLNNLSKVLQSLVECAEMLWCKLDKIEIYDNYQLTANTITTNAEKHEYIWLAKEAQAVADGIADLIAGKTPTDKNALLPTLLQKQSRWDAAKTAILAIKQVQTKTSHEKTNENKSQNKRMTWRIGKSQFGRFIIEPCEQINTKGNWFDGHSITLSRLFTTCRNMDFLTEQDIKICNCLQAKKKFNNIEYNFTSEIYLHLVGHPLVFNIFEPTIRYTIQQIKPKLLIETDDVGSSTIKITPFPPLNEDSAKNKTPLIFCEIKKDDSIVTVCSFDDTQLKIAKIISKIGLPIPKQQEKEATQLLEPLINDFQVNAIGKIGETVAASLQTTKTVDADSKIYLRLTQNNNKLFAELSVFPLGKNNPAEQPFTGSIAVFGKQNENNVVANRDFAEEKKNLDHVLYACPTLQHAKRNGQEYVIESLSNVLELLESLPNLDKKNVIVEWTKEAQYNVSKTASFGNLSLKLSSGTDWFEANGNLKIDNINLDLQTLLQSIKNTKDRFIKLNNKQYLALTEEFRKKLDEFQSYTHQHGKQTLIHPLAVNAIDNLASEFNQTNKQCIDFDKEWKKSIAQFKKASEYEPQIPKTFQCDMRDYQKDGFTWLAQLSAWGAGACLADDMGLGKTIQGLALLLLRKNEGPALVVAPTSVCENWEREANRFAPVLNILRISAQTGQSGDNYKKERAKIIKNAKKSDVIITNYSLLQIEQKHFTSKKFATIILDEAQAIKNAETIRTKVAFDLCGDFRVAMTGTPIENHLGEFWSIFNFINSGFLGTKQEFERRFAFADKQAKQQLKMLVKPFILRRTKSEVLSELPPKTEIRLDVGLSDEEAALYETIRHDALKKIEKNKNDNIGSQHLKILAEIMRLRRTCCHPNLVLPDKVADTVPCSKLDLLEDVVQELLENNHKALVFSQFVDYLQLIKKRLDKLDISYQYLDGSMTQAKRQLAVDAFQNGESDLFLISLKAGGFGLNLTAADYVIIMDPWWNPAVENQASDRAHRIGQQRPVTIYRMITKGTIEEKIIELHEKKLALANEILDGTGEATKLSLQQLLDILKRN